MRSKKKQMILGVMIAILIGLVGNPVQAVNETNDTKQNTTTQESQQQTTNQTSNTEKRKSSNAVVEKSSNANLSDFGIRPHDFTGFKYGTTNYEVSVPENTESVEVYATAQDAKAKITGIGKKALEKGKNAVQVVVTAQDGTKKTYTINITREMQKEGEEDKKDTKQEEIKDTNEKEGKGLVSLKINDLILRPEFKTNVYEYTIKYVGEDVKLNIQTETTKEDYVVEVIGNDNLQEGENTITILVSEKNGDNVATYQITVNKSLVDEEAIAKEKAEKKEKRQKIIIGAGIIVIVLGIVIIIVIRKRNRNIAEEFSGIGFYEEEEDEEEMPRAFKASQHLKEEEDFELEEGEEIEENFERMSKDELKEKFLNEYHSGMDIKFEDNNIYHDKRRKGKHKGKRFK